MSQRVFSLFLSAGGHGEGQCCGLTWQLATKHQNRSLTPPLPPQWYEEEEWTKGKTCGCSCTPAHQLNLGNGKKSLIS